jgi:hypothetical protein
MVDRKPHYEATKKTKILFLFYFIKVENHTH